MTCYRRHHPAAYAARLANRVVTWRLTPRSANPFGFDADDNRITTSYRTDTEARLVNDTTFTYTANDVGNLIGPSMGADEETCELNYDYLSYGRPKDENHRIRQIGEDARFVNIARKRKTNLWLEP